MKIILSPAKSLNEQALCSKHEFTQPAFLSESKKLVDKIKKVSVKKIGKLMAISPELADLNYQRFQSWQLPFTEVNAKPAGYIFSGAAYQGLEFSRLDKMSKERGQRDLRILSGLYGLLKPFDLIQPYRLEMGTSFATSSKVKNLYQFWGDKLRLKLEQELSLESNPLLVNVASSEYSKAAQLEKIKYPVVTAIFKDKSKTGEYKVNMTFAKQARGMMVRYILENNLTKQEELQRFDSNGYYFVTKLSTTSEFVFYRDKP